MLSERNTRIFKDLNIEIIATLTERARIRTELINWLIGDISPSDAGLINGRRITTEIDRICPKEW